MKNATKSNLMQMKAIEIVLNAMRSIMDNGTNAIRECNTDMFLSQLNKTLIYYDPEFAHDKGITDKSADLSQGGFQSPEQLAEEEAEREKRMQE